MSFICLRFDVQEQSELNNQGRGKDLDEDNKMFVLNIMR